MKATKKELYRFDDAYKTIYIYENGAYVFFAKYDQYAIKSSHSTKYQKAKLTKMLKNN